MKRVFHFILLLINLIFVSAGYAYWFEEIQQAQGGDNDHAKSCAWGDFNNDGFQDLFVAGSDVGNSHLYVNINGIFGDSSLARGISIGGVRASSWGDFDNDGNIDLFIVPDQLLYSPNILYRNSGPPEYTFTSVHPEVGDSLAGTAAVWGDFNNDGLLDIYLMNSRFNPEGPCKMFRNNGNGFEEQTCVPAEINESLTGVAGDIDNDGDLDIYVVTEGIGMKLYVNQLAQGNEWLFVEEAADRQAQMPDVQATSASFCDYDYDLDLDLLVTGGEANYLFENDGTGHFTQRAEEERLDQEGGAGAAWADFDLDGDFDVVIINSPEPVERFYKNMHRENFPYFINSTSDAGIGDDAITYSVEWADYDFDGKPDFFMGNYIASPADHDKLYRNIYPESHKFLLVKLIGTGSNRDGIGAHIVLEYQANGSPTQQMAEVSGGGTGGTSQGSLPIEFGVGEALYVDAVKVYWPAGDTSILEHVPTDRRIVIAGVKVYWVAV